MEKQISQYIEHLANKIPCALYWLNLDYIVIGVNNRLLKAIGAKFAKDIIGKTVYDFYPKHIADNLQSDFRLAVETGQDLESEHLIKDITTSKLRYFAATVSPLYDDFQKVIGIIGSSIEITAIKEVDSLKIENEINKAKLREHSKFITFVENIQREINMYKMAYINDKVGSYVNISETDKKIQLSTRQYQILYFLSLNKSPKEIATILEKIENKSITQATVTSVICKALYPKFNVFNVSHLIEKAYQLNLIPFIPDSINLTITQKE